MTKNIENMLGARELTGENLKDVWAEFSTLSYAVLVKNVIARYS